MQTYYTGEDIEDLAARGIRRLEIGPGVALTDIAREMASQLGIELVNGFQPNDSPVRKPAAPPTRLGPKPRGCQHGPIQTGSSSNSSSRPAANRGASGDVVNNLVELVSRLADQGE